jgi:hypothetical protein
VTPWKLARDAAGVDRAILIPPSWEGDCNDLALETALLRSDRFNVTEAYPYPYLHAPIRRVVGAYGWHWVFWGTDLPRLRGLYRQAFTPFTEEPDFLSDIDTAWIMDRDIAE